MIAFRYSGQDMEDHVASDIKHEHNNGAEDNNEAQRDPTEETHGVQQNGANKFLKGLASGPPEHATHHGNFRLRLIIRISTVFFNLHLKWVFLGAFCSIFYNLSQDLEGTQLFFLHPPSFHFENQFLEGFQLPRCFFFSFFNFQGFEKKSGVRRMRGAALGARDLFTPQRSLEAAETHGVRAGQQ